MATLNLHISKNKGPMSKIQIDSNRTISQDSFSDCKWLFSLLIFK
jgi:hypothetical protein